MNTSIPMMGVQPDFVNVLAQSSQAAGMTNAVQQQNALAQVYRTQGADILAGQPNAMNALASIDPTLALGIQDQRQTMAARTQAMEQSQEEMRMRREANARAAEEWAMTLDANERTERLREGTEMMGRFIAAETPEAWSALMTSLGKPEVPFSERGAMIDRMRDPIDALARYDAQNAPAEIPSGAQTLAWRAQQAGLQPGTPEYQAFMASGGEIPQSTTVYGPDGLPVYQTGPASGAVGNMPEGQSQNAIFATRARAALEDLEGGDPTALTSYGQRFLGAVPMNLGRPFQSSEFQEAENAGTRFLQAVLRKDTGAAITAEEQREYGGVYLPQPGDTPQMAEARRQARNEALIAIESGMSADALLAQSKALLALGVNSEAGTPIEGADEPATGAEAITTLPSVVRAADIPLYSQDVLTQYLESTPGDQIPDDVWAAISARAGVQ